MVENKIKLFQNQKIRTIWDEVREDWLFSAVDICGALTEQPDIAGARNYWKVLKSRLSEEGSELVTKCNQLKMLAQDGKKYKTDCFYTQDVLRLIQSIPSKKAEPFKLWLAQVGRERLDEIADPEQIVFNMLAEATTTELSRTKAPDGFKESKDIAREGGNTAGEARKIVEEKLGKSILTSELPELEKPQEEQYHDEESDFALILAHLQKSGSLSISQIDEFIGGISRRTLHRRLKRMVELGLIESHGATNLARYTIKARRGDKGSQKGFPERDRFAR